MSNLGLLPIFEVHAGAQVDEDLALSFVFSLADGVTPFDLSGITFTATLWNEQAPAFVMVGEISGASHNILSFSATAQEKSSLKKGVYLFTVLATAAEGARDLLGHSTLSIGMPQVTKVSALLGAGGLPTAFYSAIPASFAVLIGDAAAGVADAQAAATAAADSASAAADSADAAAASAAGVADAQASAAASASASAGSAAAAEASAVAAAAQFTASFSYDTLAQLNADLAHDEGITAQVLNDATASNNGFYVKSGISGAGSWVKKSAATILTLDQLTKANAISSGELLSTRSYNPSLSALNGSTAITASNKVVGFTVPAGSSGSASQITAYLKFSPPEVARLTGKTITLTAIATATANFATDKLLSNTGVAQARRGGAPGTLVGTHISTTQVGTTLIRKVSYTVTSADTEIGVLFILSGTSPVKLVDYSLQIVSLSWQVSALASTTASTSLADEVLGAYFDRLTSRSTIGLGSVYSDVTTATVLNGGAVLRSSKLGLTIPAGETGGTAAIYYQFNVDAADVALYAGRTVRFRLAFDTSANLARALSVQLQGRIGTTAEPVAASFPALNLQSGARRIIEIEGIMSGLSTQFRVIVSNTTAVIAAQDDWFDLTDMTIEIAYSPSDMLAIGVENAEARGRRALAKAKASMGGIFAFSDIAPNSQILGGATALTSNGRVMGYSIPQGQDGGASFVQYNLPLNGAALAGRTIQVTMGFTTSANYARTFVAVLRVVTPSGNVSLSVSPIKNVQSGTRRVIVMQGVLAGTEIKLAPYIQNAAAVTAQDDSIVLTDFIYEIVNTTSDVMSAQQEQALIAKGTTVASAVAKAKLPYQDYGKKVYVRPDGTGDYTTINAAVNAVNGQGTADARVAVIIGEGIYDEYNINPSDFTDLIADGPDPYKHWIRAALPDDVDPAQIPLTQGVWGNSTQRVIGLRITIQNGRYAIHSDAGGINKNDLLEIRDCVLEHFGNESARAYQVGLGNDPSIVWQSTTALGYGGASGHSILADRVEFRSPTEALGVHSNNQTSDPQYHRYTNCRFHNLGATDDLEAIRFRAVGSGQRDIYELVGCELVGPLMFSASPWLDTTPAGQLANKAAEMGIVGHGNTMVAYSNLETHYVALRIDSASTAAGSAIALLGDAVPVLFGDVITYPGGGGLKGGAYGTWDVSGYGVGLRQDVFITSLGYRLGDCSLIWKTLQILIDGSGSPITVQFNQDYTAQSNDTILAAINAAISPGAVASLFNVNSLFYPTFCDQEAYLLNADTVAIKRSQGVAYSGSVRKGRLMLSTDPAAVFAGIALEDIRPGERGRVKTRGVVRVSQNMDRSDAGSFVFGDAFGIGATPGRFTKSPSVSLLTAVGTLDASWNVP